MELTDLEICKEISMMELKRQFPEAKTIEFNERQNCFWVEAVGFISWPLLDPLTDDALCFQLMVKYDVKREWEAYDFIGWNYHCIDNKNPERITERTFFGKGKETADISPNKAICLAIIEAYKDNV